MAIPHNANSRKKWYNIDSLCGHYERIIVEPSGVFDAAVFYSIMDTLQRKTEAELGFCAVIVDPHGLAELDDASLAVLQSQLAGAGSILWSKCDLPDVPDLHECTALLHTLLPDLPPGETASTRDFTDFALLQTRTGHLRIDTHADNHVMQRCILREGFSRCGVIYVADGSARVAFERI